MAQIFDLYDAESPVATELRRLYNNIKLRSMHTDAKSFMFTSSDLGEGKSTITALLAITIARSRRRKVLVVDADLRRPRVHKIFELQNKRGFATCLESAVNPLDVVQKTSLPNLDVISSGGRRQNPSALFEAENLSDFFAKVKFYYDCVLVDSPPVLPVSDTLFLCPEVETVMLVVMAGETPHEAVIRAKELLVNAHANLGGVIVNNALDILPFYYSYRYYGYRED